MKCTRKGQINVDYLVLKEWVGNAIVMRQGSHNELFLGRWEAAVFLHCRKNRTGRHGLNKHGRDISQSQEEFLEPRVYNIVSKIIKFLFINIKKHIRPGLNIAR